MLHKALQNKWARVLIAVFATFLYALGVNLFVVPMGLYSGGVVGLSQIIRTLLAQAVELPAGVDIAGILYFLINIPVLYLAWRDLGRAFFDPHADLRGRVVALFERDPVARRADFGRSSRLVPRRRHSVRLCPRRGSDLRLLDRRA